MEQQLDTTEENVPGVGLQQSKLAIRIRDDRRLLTTQYLYQRKAKHISTPALARGLLAIDALESAVQTMIKCLESHSDREDFARSMLESMEHE